MILHPATSILLELIDLFQLWIYPALNIGLIWFNKRNRNTSELNVTEGSVLIGA